MSETQASARQPLSKKLRFEVFKRDKFTCQYCGQSAPTVVLHCDHIVPVAGGGKNDILNLITSCQPCNAGKSATPLDKQKELSSQIDQLKDLEARRQQLEMLIEWRAELSSLVNSEVETIARSLNRGGWEYNENGKNSIKRWLKTYSVAELLEAIDQSFESYEVWDEDKITESSYDLCMSRIIAIAKVQREAVDKPWLPRLYYIQGILRRKHRCTYLNRIDYLKHLVESGATVERLEEVAKHFRTLSEFEAHCDAWLSSIGRPY